MSKNKVLKDLVLGEDLLSTSQTAPSSYDLAWQKEQASLLPSVL